ncbi:MAG: prolipoprotein diacylglyceryl transferase, partial [Clostridia bacterium]
DNFIDALIWAVPVAIIFARLYYVAFNFEPYRNDPIKILYIWEGGIAIYGSIIGAIAAMAVYCKVKKISLLSMLDLGVLGLLIGQTIGRWGNFVNGEAYGTATNLPWRMEIFDVESMSRMAVHPTFLYESLWNIIGFILLHFRSKKRRFKGEIFLLYTAWYGFGRGLIEGLRTDSLYFMGTGLRVSQFLGFATCLIAVVILFIKYVFCDKEVPTKISDEFTEDNDNVSKDN